MAIDLIALKEELLIDPEGVGYAAFIIPGGISSNHIAALGNAKNPSIQVDDTRLILSSDIMLAVDQAEYDGLSDRKALQWQTFISSAEAIDLSNQRARNLVVAVFGNPSTTLTSIIALARRDGSRFEQLFPGERVGRVEISAALKGHVRV